MEKDKKIEYLLKNGSFYGNSIHCWSGPRGRLYRRRSNRLSSPSPSIHGVEKKPMPHLLCTTNMILHGIDVPSNIKHDNTLARPLIRGLLLLPNSSPSGIGPYLSANC